MKKNNNNDAPQAEKIIRSFVAKRNRNHVNTTIQAELIFYIYTQATRNALEARRSPYKHVIVLAQNRCKQTLVALEYQIIEQI